ncbi:helix-turn-helix domain-containing protein [Dactylosporangium sp. NPDC000521]|uniref:helix-turn-helix domain-containing protein n=1 Tax=Dactylosporangium sp. NPDC000521 TaxID=3363975 RepID=UPI0036D1F65B
MEAEQRFGSELRRLRHESGFSLSDLAGRVHYSKSHLSKVENGDKTPSEALARQCDAVLHAGGALLRLAVPAPARTDRGPAGAAPARTRDERWTLTLTDGDGRLAVGPDGTPGELEVNRWAVPHADRAGRLPEGTVEMFGVILGDLRRLGQWQPPAVVLPGVLAHAATLRSLAGRVTPAERPAVLVMASRFAEYAGWCLQEAGDDHGALTWTARAARLALDAGDDQFAAYADVRRALVALYHHDAVETVALARRGAQAAADHRIRGLAVQREAQGHALGGDESACHRALDRAAEHLSLADAPDGTPVIGTSTLTDPVAMVRGWCLYDLGRPGAAAETLERELDKVPPGALRTRVRFGARLALAYADADEVEQACATVLPLLGPAVHVDSATVRADLDRLSRALRRQHQETAVRELLPRLNAVLHTASIA